MSYELGPLSLREVFRDVILMVVLTAVAGFAASLEHGERFTRAMTLYVLIASTTAFTISGCLHSERRWDYLWSVFVWSWVLGLINVLFGEAPYLWLLSIIPLLVTMVVGGVLSMIFRPAKR